MNTMLSPEQREYIAARENFKEVKAQIRQDCGTCPRDEAGMDAFIAREIEAEQKHGYHQAWHRLNFAEEAMIGWVQSVMEHHHMWEKIAPAFRAKGKLRMELIELCLQLDAKSAEKFFKSLGISAK